MSFSFRALVVKDSKKSNNFREVERKLYSSHLKCVYSSVFYPSKSLLFTCSLDSKIIVTSSKTHAIITSLPHHKSAVRHMIDWNGSSVMSCSADTSIKVFSIVYPFTVIREFHQNPAKVFRVMKIDEDRFVSRNYDSDIFVFSYSTGEVLKKYYVGLLWRVYTKLIPSQKYEKSFYLNIHDSEESILCVDTELDTVTRKFSKHSSNRILSILVLSENDEEYVIALGRHHQVYVYNTSSMLFTTSLLIRTISRIDVLKSQSFPFDSVYCSFIHEKYIFSGDKKGNLITYELPSFETPRDLPKISEINLCRVEECHSGPVRDIIPMSGYSVYNNMNNIHILTCSDDKSFKVTEVMNLKLKEMSIFTPPSPSSMDLTRKIEQLVENSGDLKKQISTLKEFAEKTTDEMKKLRAANDRISSNFTKVVSSLREENHQLREKISGQQREISDLKDYNSKVTKDLDIIREQYYIHIDSYHTLKYAIEKFDTMPTCKGNFSVFLNRPVEFECLFKIVSGSQSLKRKSLIDFRDLKVSVDGHPIEKFEIIATKIEFTHTFVKEGGAKVLIEFKNIREEYLMKVFDASASDKTSTIEVSSSFGIGELFRFSVTFRNTGEIPVPWVSLEDMNFAAFVKRKNHKRSIKSLIVELDEDQYSMQDGIIECFDLFKIGKKFEVGEYELVLNNVGGGFEIVKEFEIIE